MVFGLIGNYTIYIMKMAYTKQLSAPPQNDGAYFAPAVRLIKIEAHRRICDVSPNASPDLEWGGDYDQEPED